jgi:glutamyl-Q tRNA(Asp) synthetase
MRSKMYQLETILQINIKTAPAPWITRFAPSPTGYLHLGHVLSMAFVFGISKAIGAKLLLRIEDHDKSRCRPEFESEIYQDLKWFGFDFDEQPQFQKKSNLRQSDRIERYESYLAILEAKNLVYACDCSRAKIHQTLMAQNVGVKDELFYPGSCRGRARPEFSSDFGLRFITPNRDVCFWDGLHGMTIQNPQKQCGDFLIKDRHGNFTYQFAVVVDDLDQGVNLIIRGDDILHASGRQIVLAETLGRTVPIQFLHHPLLTDESGKKLGKRFFSEAVAKRRANGERPEDLLASALFLAGVTKNQEPIKTSELKDLFTLGTNHGPS